MKFRISLALNLLLVGLLAWQHMGRSIADFYYRKTVYTVVAGAVTELDKGNTKQVREALATIWESGRADEQILYKAGEKLGVIITPSQGKPPGQGQ